MNTQRPDADRPDQGQVTACDGCRRAAACASEARAQAAGDKEEAEPGDQTGGSEQRDRSLERELASTRDRLMRALADQENGRRRAQRDREEAVRYANADLARDLLPIIDNLTRALDSLPEEDVADETMLQILRGVSAIERQMLQALERHGIRQFEPVGEAFDPNFHHAVFQNDTSDQPAGTVTEVLQPGYLYNDRLLRPAMVGVAGKADPQAPSADEMRHAHTHHDITDRG